MYRIAILLTAAASLCLGWSASAQPAAPTVPQFPDEPGFVAYFAKPTFTPSPGPDGEPDLGRRFDVTSGAGPANDLSGVLLEGVVQPGKYKVSIYARASAPGPTIRLGISDKFAGEPMPLSTDWQEFSTVLDVTEPTDRAGQWVRQGNINGGWVDVARFAIEPYVEPAKPPVIVGIESLPRFADDPAFAAYYVKPTFIPTDSPFGKGTGRRFDASSGGSDGGNISGVVFPGVVEPGKYKVSMYARASASGPKLAIGIDDDAMSPPFTLGTAWREFSATVDVAKPTERAGQWFRTGNIKDGWIEVAQFTIAKIDTPPAAASAPAGAKRPVAKAEPCVAQAYVVPFGPQSTSISASDIPKVKRLAARAKASACKVRIEGYANLDERNPNQVSKARATAVLKAFSAAGFSGGAIEAVGRGGTRAFGSQNADNRRVIISVRP